MTSDRIKHKHMPISVFFPAVMERLFQNTFLTFP